MKRSLRQPSVAADKSVIKFSAKGFSLGITVDRASVLFHSVHVLQSNQDVASNAENDVDYQNPHQLSEDQTKRFLENKCDDHPSFGTVFEYVLSTSDTVESLDWLYCRVDDVANGKYAQRIVEKLRTIEEKVFNVWWDVYDNSVIIDEFTSVVLRKCISLAKDPDDWNSLYQSTGGSKEEDRKIILAALKEAQLSEKQWEEFLNNCQYGFEPIICEKLLALKDTTFQILEFYIQTVKDLTLDNDSHKVFFDKLFRIATPEEIQIIGLLSKEKELDELDDAAKEFLKS